MSGSSGVHETPTSAGYAAFGSRSGRRVAECIDLSTDSARLDSGLWFVVADFDGPERQGRSLAWRFTDVVTAPEPARTPASPQQDPGATPGWQGPAPDAWSSSLSRAQYESAVVRVREHVREGDVYQANVCRIMSAPLPREGGAEPDALGLSRILQAQNPAPFAGLIHVPASTGLPPLWVVTASPELFLRRADGVLTSGPIKGTARTVAGLQEKDRAENVMITDLVRNDLQRVCAAGTVEVTDLLAVEEHPGLVHLVSRIAGRLTPEVATSSDLWGQVLGATFPPASVSGAPKSSALRIIHELESVPRGPYCGAVGWIDGDTGEAELAVGIRTFWWSDDVLRFGTGAGITWGSDPTGEWEETELKAHRLIALASSGRDRR